MSVTPPRTNASASPTFCTHCPTAPCAICRSAIAADLCVLACGRTRTPVERAKSAIFAMFRSSASRSTMSAGVSISATGAPISAGGGFIGLPEKHRGVAYSRPAGLVHFARAARARSECLDFHERCPQHSHRRHPQELWASRSSPRRLVRRASRQRRERHRRERIRQKHTAALRELSRAAGFRRDLHRRRAAGHAGGCARQEPAALARPRSTRCAANWVSCSSSSICGRT